MFFINHTSPSNNKLFHLLTFAMTKMIKFDNFTCNNSFSSFGHTFLMLNCYQIVDGSRDHREPDMGKPCSELCAVNSSYVVDYEKWKLMDLNYLGKACTNKGRCDFAISTSFNFNGSYWISGDDKLENITWKSVAYPRLNDLLTVCGFETITSIDFHANLWKTEHFEKVDLSVILNY